MLTVIISRFCLFLFFTSIFDSCGGHLEVQLQGPQMTGSYPCCLSGYMRLLMANSEAASGVPIWVPVGIFVQNALNWRLMLVWTKLSKMCCRLDFFSPNPPFSPSSRNDQTLVIVWRRLSTIIPSSSPQCLTGSSSHKFLSN